MAKTAEAEILANCPYKVVPGVQVHGHQAGPGGRAGGGEAGGRRS
jgi:hypothetical protein